MWGGGEWAVDEAGRVGWGVGGAARTVYQQPPVLKRPSAPTLTHARKTRTHTF